jgi:hypothetical protein
VCVRRYVEGMRARVPTALQGPLDVSGQEATPLGTQRVARIVDKMLHNLWLVGCSAGLVLGIILLKVEPQRSDTLFLPLSKMLQVVVAFMYAAEPSTLPCFCAHRWATSSCCSQRHASCTWLAIPWMQVGPFLRHLPEKWGSLCSFLLKTCCLYHPGNFTALVSESVSPGSCVVPALLLDQPHSLHSQGQTTGVNGIHSCCLSSALHQQA